MAEFWCLNVISLVLAFFLDLGLGDPRNFPHPVVGMGKAALFLEKPLRAFARRFPGKKGELVAGAFLVLAVVGGSLAGTKILVFLSFRLNRWVGIGVSALLIYVCIAVRSLNAHGEAVARPLAAGYLQAAREAVSLIVGRDTTTLSEREVARAAIESIAENTSDGVVAPLFYAALGGAPLAFAYRAVNTLDAMYGYREAPNLYFGRAAARSDDFLGFLPARLSALLLILAGFFMGKNARVAWQVFRADRKKHLSPNSGHPEAALAGLLGVRLGGPTAYRGVVSLHPYLHAQAPPPAPEDIFAALSIMKVAAVFALIFSMALSALLAALGGRS